MARRDGELYTSARLLTKDTFTFTYGRIETRLRVPRGGGLWPAVWTLAANIGEESEQDECSKCMQNSRSP